MIKRPRQVVSLLLAVLLLYEQSALGQLILPNPDIYFSPVIFSVDKFRPIHLRYLDAGSPEGILRFMLDKGDLKNITAEDVSASSRGLVDYFLVGLSLPDKSFWVNLRPDRPDNIIDQELEKTDIGKVFLEADLNLKKDMAGLTSPRTPSGKQYWNKLYAKARELFGAEQIELPAYTRPWIVPGEIIVRQSKANAYIYKADLKVMLEEDYLRDKSAPLFTDPRFKELNEYSSVLLRELVIPKLTQEVNSGRRYAPLRQVYYSLIFARWFKEYAKTALPVLENRQGLPDKYAARIDSGDLNGLFSKKSWSKTDYFNQYKRSFGRGEYNESEFINTPDGQTVRQYVSGGISFDFSLGAAGGAGITVVNAANDLPFIPGTVGITLTSDNRVVIGTDARDTSARAEERVKAPDGGGNLRGSNAAYDSGKLESFLLAQGNPAGQTVIVKEMLGHRETLLEIGSGRAIAAFALAAKNRDIGVIATDIYDDKAKEDIYRKFADEWKSGKLTGQEIKLDNLAVLRSGVDIINYFPDSSLDYILLVSPELNAVEQLSGLIKNEEALRKLKPGGKIVIRSYWWGIDYYNSLFGEGFKFKRAGIDFLGVNLRAVSHFEGNDELYVWTKDGGDETPELIRVYKEMVRDYFSEYRKAIDARERGLAQMVFNRALLENYLVLMRRLTMILEAGGEPVTYIYPLSGIDPVPAIYGKTCLINEDILDYDRGGRLLARVCAGMEFPSSFADLKYLGSDAANIEHYKEIRRQTKGRCVLLLKGFTSFGSRMRPPPRELLKSIFTEVLREGDAVLALDKYDAETARKIGAECGFVPLSGKIYKSTGQWQVRLGESSKVFLIPDAVLILEKIHSSNGARMIEPDVPGAINKLLSDNPYFRSLSGKIVPRINDIVGRGVLNYIEHRKLAKYGYLMTSDIDPEKDLPLEYPVIKGLREPRSFGRELPGVISDVTKVDVVLPDSDIFLTSSYHNGSGGCVKLGFLLNKYPVALKTYLFSYAENHGMNAQDERERIVAQRGELLRRNSAFTKGTKDFFEQELFRSYRSGVIADNLGIGPRMHGFFEDNDGLLWIVMDIVPGDFEPDDDKLVTLETINELVEINNRLKKAGFSTVDFQYYITPGGRIVVIDTYFEASANPGIGHFAEEMTELAGYADKEVRERAMVLMRELGLENSDGGDAVLSVVPAAANINGRAGQSFGQDAKGGIDFRSLPVTAENADVSGGKILSSRPAASIPAAGLDKEWGAIRELVTSGNIPAAAKIRDYWISAGGSGSGEKQKILCCVMEIMRMEEEYVVPCEPGLLELLKALESGDD